MQPEFHSGAVTRPLSAYIGDSQSPCLHVAYLYSLSILHRRASVKSILCLGDINATPRGLNLSMTSSIPVNTRGQSDRNGYALAKEVLETLEVKRLASGGTETGRGQSLLPRGLSSSDPR